ncbi:MAG: hypothetical protein OXG02_07125 [Chloroflexi bacterium]|nr:hypothetical protein [Chloroflexota bacterium]
MFTYQALPGDLPTILLSYVVYAIVAWIYGRWLRHWFGKRAQRFGWLLLAGQVLLLTMHGWPVGSHEWWNHDAEYNIPVTLATFQVLASSFLALGVTLYAPVRARWQRGYWGLLSLGFFVLAQDEFGVLHDRLPFLEDFYLSGGILVALLTIVIWRTMAEDKRRFLYLIIVGLGVSVVGAEVLDKLEYTCADFLQVFSLGCARLHPLEETFEKLGAFFTLLAILGMAERTLKTEHWQRLTRQSLWVFSLVSLLLFAHFRNLQAHFDIGIRSSYSPVDYRYQTRFANGYLLRGTDFHEGDQIHNGKYHLLYVYGEIVQPLAADFGYSILIIDQVNGDVYAAHEHWGRRAADEWLMRRMYKEYQHLWIPEDVPGQRALWFVLSLWQETEADRFSILPIRSSNDHQLSDTQIVLREFVIREESVVAWPADALDYRFANGFVLRGAALPESARPGERLAIAMSWEAASDGEEDWVQFLHFVHEESGALWNHDQPPLGARLPTRLWYEGLRDTEIWQVALPAELAPGRYAIYTGLYRLSDLARLPVQDENGVPFPDARVPLGQLTISE